jgi:hypothetical protein
MPAGTPALAGRPVVWLRAAAAAGVARVRRARDAGGGGGAGAGGDAPGVGDDGTRGGALEAGSGETGPAGSGETGPADDDEVDPAGGLMVVLPAVTGGDDGRGRGRGRGGDQSLGHGDGGDSNSDDDRGDGDDDDSDDGDDGAGGAWQDAAMSAWLQLAAALPGSPQAAGRTVGGVLLPWGAAPLAEVVGAPPRGLPRVLYGLRDGAVA